MKQSVPRLRSVRFKDGRAPLRIVRPGSAERNVRDEFRKDVDVLLSGWSRDEMAGYAIAVWDRDTGNAVYWFIGDRVSVHASLVPSFVHDLLHRRIVIDRTKRELGYDPPDRPA